MPLPPVLRLLALFLSLASLAEAHSGGAPGGPQSGVAIANLTHGQMAVIARHDGAILALAASAAAPDQDFRRVLNYARIQKTYCAFGLMPRAVSDEASPFNHCSHAYLAAARDLLLRLKEMPGRAAAVDTLIRRIETEMIRNNSGLELCQYSAEGFNTAQTLTPDWGAALRHPPSLATLAALLLSLAALGLAARRFLR